MKSSRQSKLTPVVDPSVVRRAKTWASDHNTSVASLVEALLNNLTTEEQEVTDIDPDSWPRVT